MSLHRIGRPRLTVGLAAAALSFALSASAATPNPDPLNLEQWKAKRVANLTSETGWLTLVGLYWLKAGDNSFGRATSNRIVLDHPSLAATSGKFTVKDGGVTFVSAPGALITQDKAPVSTGDSLATRSSTSSPVSAGDSLATRASSPVTSIVMTPDTKGEPTMLASGSLRFFVIERAGRLGIRVRDVNHPARTQFQGLEYFPANDAWTVDARFEPYTNKRLPIVNILGMTDQMVSPGAIVFTWNGREWRLDTILEEPDDTELFLMFADATSARETYGAGRFMYIPMPHDGHVTVDFNRAYNPPCAFNEFATCPLPPPQNRLQMRVDAGEKKYQAAKH
jgi:uncharacterized protein (DUF1684 family)